MWRFGCKVIETGSIGMDKIMCWRKKGFLKKAFELEISQVFVRTEFAVVFSPEEL